MNRIAYTGARIFDGETMHERSALVVADGRIEQIIAADSPTDALRPPTCVRIIPPAFLHPPLPGAGSRHRGTAPGYATAPPDGKTAPSSRATPPRTGLLRSPGTSSRSPWEW